MPWVGFLAVLVTAGIVLPHLLPLRRADPLGSILAWCAGLGLRALVGVFCVIWIVLFLPTTELFSALTHWCWHEVLPALAMHLGLDGYRIGSAAAVTPALLLSGSLASVGFGVWRVARAVRRWIKSSALGQGPGDSVIVGGADVLVAAAGIGRPRVVVSTGALTSFDDDELAAALEHERGHIAHRHRFVLLFAELCRAVGRFLPGTKRAVRELAFHLERDADRWALRSHDRFALASAILKAAGSQQQSYGAAVTQLSGAGELEARLGALVDSGSPSTISRRGLRMVGASFAALTLALVISVPSTVAAVLEVPRVPAAHDCPS